MWTNEQKKVIATTALTNMMPGAHLDFWQSWYLCQNVRFGHMLKSRRVGFSFINSIKPIAEANYPQMKRYQKVILSYSLNESMGKIKDAREALMNLPESWRKELKTDSKTALEFWDVGKKSVSQIISIPAKSARGLGTANEYGGVVADEAAEIADFDNIYTSILPTLSRGGTFWMGGTPKGKDDLFYKVHADKERYKSYTRIEIPWYYSSANCLDIKTAITEAPKLTTHERVERFGNDILQDIFQNIGLRQFQQEYEITFQDQNDAFITLEMIMSCTPQKVEQYEYQNISEILNGIEIPEICTGIAPDGQPIFESVHAPAYDPEIHGFLYAGWDMGRTKDASIFTLIGFKDGKKHVWMSYELKNKKFDEQKKFAELAMSSLPIRQFLIDRNGLGMDFAEWAETKFPTRAHGVNFTNETKEDMANKVYLGCERREYVFPMNRKLHADIHCIRKTTTAMKYNRYDGSTKDSHADRFWSLALATVSIEDEAGRKSRFYEGYRKSKGIETVKKEKVNTGSPELDRLIRRNRKRSRRHDRG